MTTLSPTIEDRLDALAGQVSELAAELGRQRDARERWAELAQDVTPIAGQALERVGAELEESGLTGDDAIGVLRDLAAALPELRGALRQLSAIADLARTAAPIAGPAMDSMTARIGELEARGYIDFARSGAGVFDKIVGAFSEDDVDALGDNIVLILNTVKEMTQPEVMQMLQRTLHTVQEAEPTEPPSLFAIVRELRDPEVRRGLDRVLTALRSVGAGQPVDTDQSRKE